MQRDQKQVSTAKKQVGTAYNLDKSLYSMSLKKQLFLSPLLSLPLVFNLVSSMGLAKKLHSRLWLTTATTHCNPSRRVAGGYEGARRPKYRREYCYKFLPLTLASPQRVAYHVKSHPFYSSGNPLPKKKVAQS